MKKWKTIIVLSTLLALLVSACGKSSEPSPSGGNADRSNVNGSNDSAADSGGGQKRTLTIALPQDVVSTDMYAFNDHVSWMAVNNLYNGLFKRNADGDIMLDLAESFEKIDDTTWEVTLKQGVKFHNGEEMTAEDVKFSLERAATEETLAERSAFSSIKEVKVIDPYKAHIITHEPNPLLTGVLARTSAVIYPKAYIEEHGIEHFIENPVGTGPFKLKEWQRGSHMTLEPFSDYFEGPVEDWEKVVFRILPEASTRVGELLTGGVDIIPAVASNEWSRIENSDKAQLVFGLSNRVAHIVPKGTPGSPMADRRVREAVELAIDNNLIIEKLLGGQATPVRTRVTKGNVGANESLFNVYLYDPERAKQLLKEAGYENGLEITIQSSNGRYARDKEVAEMIVGMLAQVGIKAKLELPEWNTYLELRNANKVADLHMLWFANSFFDAHIMINEHFTGTRKLENLGFENEELVDVLKRAQNNMNEAERIQLYQRAQEIEAEERYRIYLYLEHNAYGVNKSVRFQPRLDEMFELYEIKAN